MTVMTSPSRSVFEGISILVGLVGILSGVFYFLWAYGIIHTAYEIPTETLLLFFPAMTLVSGIVLLLSTIGMLSMK
ncbi:hypothetical protein KY308_01000 [Candidatus Woesearchaeota archaeon]|nr:hypothetical protein [Candidatus Woesearchaeota archaeon]